MAKDIFKTDFCKITKFSCTCGRIYINTSNCKQCTCGNEKQNNADRIRAMSDEELAEFLNTLFVEGQIEALFEQYTDSVFNRKESSLKWLQSEAETKGE